MNAGEEEQGGGLTSEALYELYKDALKRGHVASLRGRLDDALLAYADAARVAPERSTPHSSAGTALLRRRRPADAIRHYEVALAIAPRDEAALLGRAQALATMDRRSEAADAYDALAEIRASSGKLSDAVDAARRGLEMAEGRERRRTLERLIRRLRASEPDEPGRLALERALSVLDGTAVPQTPSVAVDLAVDATPFPEEPALAVPDPAAQSQAPLSPQARAVVAPAPVVGGPAPAPLAPAAIAWPAADRRPDRPPSVAAKPAVGRVRGPLDRDLVFGATVADLERHAREAVDAGLPGPALEAYLDLATAYRHEGHVDAALDACYAALTFDPDGIPLHLALVELYDAAGWGAAATDKLALVETLARRDDDATAIELIAAVRAGRD